MPWIADIIRTRPICIIAAGTQALAVGYTIFKLCTAAHQLYSSTPSSAIISASESSTDRTTSQEHETNFASLVPCIETESINEASGNTATDQVEEDFSSARIESNSYVAKHTYLIDGQLDTVLEEAFGEMDLSEAYSEKLCGGSESEEELEEDGGSDSDSDPDIALLESFQPVIEAINFEALASVALQARKAHTNLPESSNLTEPEIDNGLLCTVDPLPLYGSYNIVYVLLFSDGVKWIARIPGKALKFEQLDVQAMNSDYQTLRYIKQKTSLPVPDVFTWETSSEKIGTPYALMSFIAGTQICDRWFDKSWITEQKRFKILGGIASYLSQLHKLWFAQIGALRFSEEGTQPEVIGTVWLECLEDSAWGKAHLSGPYESMRDLLVDDWDEVDDCAKRAKSPMDILGLAVDSIPTFMISPRRFPLTPIDCNWQNIFIDDDANVVGFIDWDGVHARPSCLGCARYPSWITRDWDPAMYSWDPEDEDREESSPAELSRYRQHYADVFQTYTLPEYDPRETRLSHITEAIEIALNSRPCRGPIIRKLLDHAFQDECPFTMIEYADAYVEGKTYEMNQQIIAAFKHMWHAEWETRPETNPETGMVDLAEDSQEESQKVDPQVVEEEGSANR